MKMSIEDYAYLKKHIGFHIDKIGVEKAKELRNTVPFVNVQFLSFAWLMFHSANKSMAYLISDRLYEAGLNDDHIETALKKILKEYK